MGILKRSKKKKKVRENSTIVKNEPLMEQELEEEYTFIPHFSFKILLIGHNDSGKIDYLEKFGNSWFKANTKLSIGISFEVKEIKIENLNIKLQIWDIVTEDRWKDMIPYHCRGALGAILMFETSNFDTLLQLTRWVHIIRQNTNNIPMILMGNNDNLTNNRQVSMDEIMNFVKSENLNGYFECDVVGGENLENAFQSLTRLIINKYENE
jgi:small GTP-binding protein